MRTGLATTALAAALALTCSAGLAVAQTPEDTKRLAGETFRQGQAAFERRDFAAAAAAFEQAARLSPHPSAWLNAAEAWELAGQPLRAAEDCDQALAAPGIEPVHREEASARLVRLEAALARVEVRGPPNLRARFDDGTELPVPVRKRLNPGSHTVTVVDAGGAVVRTWTTTFAAGGVFDLDAAARPAPPSAAEPRAPRPATPDALPQKGASVSPSMAPPVASWISFGVAAVAGGVVGVFGARTLASQADFEDEPTTEAADTFDRDKLVTNVALGIGAAAAAIGVVIWIASASSSGPAKASRVVRFPGLARVRF